MVALGQVTDTLSDRIDRVALHRFAGVPLFLAVMYLMFTFTINVGGAFVDFFDGVAGALFVDGLGHWLRSLGSPALAEWCCSPTVSAAASRWWPPSFPSSPRSFLFLSVLEDSGYMARAAFVMDRFMRSIGLPGKAFVPAHRGLRLQRPGGDGHPHPRQRARAQAHGADESLHVLRRAAARLRAVRRGLLPARAPATWCSGSI